VTFGIEPHGHTLTSPAKFLLRCEILAGELRVLVKEHHQEYEMTAESSAMAWIRMAQRVHLFFKQRPESQIRVKKMDVRLAK
jgi:ABC-type molybdate transport system ATPase subunit